MCLLLSNAQHGDVWRMDGSGFPACSPSPGTTALLSSATGMQWGKENGKGGKHLWVSIKQPDNTTMYRGNVGEIGDN